MKQFRCLNFPIICTFRRVILVLGIAAYSLVRAVIPTKKNLIAFISTPDFSDNALAVYERIRSSRESERYRFVWLVKEPEPRINESHSQVRFVKKNSLNGLRLFLLSRYVFFTHRTYSFVRSGTHQVLINLWHGMPVKTTGAFVPNASCIQEPYSTYAVATSRFFADVISTAFSIRRSRVLVTGLPRNEWLFRTDLRHSELTHGCAGVFVWLPTFREYDVDGYQLHDASGEDVISPEALVVLDSALDGAQVKLLLKFHPGDTRNRLAWPKLRNIQVTTGIAFQQAGLNIYKLLACSDGLITDFSSIAIDFLITGKPLVLFGADATNYHRGVTPSVFEKLSEVSFTAETPEQLVAFLISLPLPKAPIGAADLLHHHELLHPSRDILLAVGLKNLAETA